MTASFESPFADEFLDGELSELDDVDNEDFAFGAAPAYESESWLVEPEGVPEMLFSQASPAGQLPSGDWESEVFVDSEYGDFEVGLEHETGTHMEQESVAYKRVRSVPAKPAIPPCHPESPASASAPKARPKGRVVPDYRPGAGRLRRTASREYIAWVQKQLNHLLGSALTVDGIFGPRTSKALRIFQKRAKIAVDGKIGPQTEAALRKWSGTEPPEREVVTEGLAPALLAVAKLGPFVLNFIKFGVEMIQKVTAGGISFSGPAKPMGIRVTNAPPEFDLKASHADALIFNYRATIGGVEAVRIKLSCEVMYNGLELQTQFRFDPAGDRSRLGADTKITIGEPFELEREIAPLEWQRCGVADYRILRIPVAIRIDRPWPLSNYAENFHLVLSTMYGLGASGSSKRAHIQKLSVDSN